jgi:hypothetical protein
VASRSLLRNRTITSRGAQSINVSDCLSIYEAINVCMYRIEAPTRYAAPIAQCYRPTSFAHLRHDVLNPSQEVIMVSGRLLKNVVGTFLVAGLLSGAVTYARSAHASYASAENAGSACSFDYTKKYLFTYKGSALTAEGGAESFDCSFASIYSIRDLQTASYVEVDTWEPNGGSVTATACAASYWSDDTDCGTPTTGTGSFNVDYGAWTRTNTTGYYPYIHIALDNRTFLHGFWFVTN